MHLFLPVNLLLGDGDSDSDKFMERSDADEISSRDQERQGWHVSLFALNKIRILCFGLVWHCSVTFEGCIKVATMLHHSAAL